MIKAALIGYGWWGQHVSRRLKDNDRIKLTGVAAPELAGQADAAGLPVYRDFDATLEDASVQAVILTSPNELHEPQAVAAARAGKHVFCEKPVALAPDSVRRIVAAAQEAGVVLGIGHERRFEPAMLELARMVREGDLGTIMHAEAAFSHDKLIGVPKDSWRTRKATAPAAGMTGMGIHLTDYLISLFGPVETVQALTADRSLGWETGDVVTAQLGFRAGMTATLSAILHTPHFIRTHVFGSDAWAEIRNDTHPDTPGGYSHMTVSRTGQTDRLTDYPWSDAVVANLETFASAIEEGTPYPFTAEQVVHNIEVLDAIARAAETRETVRL